MTPLAALLDRCSAFLVRTGARVVPRSDPSMSFGLGGNHRCKTCGHYRTEHGATGECWHTECECTPDDIRSLQRHLRARAAMRRATRNDEP